MDHKIEIIYEAPAAEIVVFDARDVLGESTEPFPGDQDNL